MGFWSDLFSGQNNNGLSDLGKDFANDIGPNSGLSKTVTGLMPWNPKQVGSSAPGAQLNTAQDTADQTQLNALIAQLQGMANTGQGNWQNQLAQTSQNAQNTAKSLGASMVNQQGLNKMVGGQNVAMGQANAQQLGNQQGQQLQGAEELQAQQALSQILGLEGSQNLTVAQQAAAAQQAVNQINSQMALNAQQNQMNFFGGVGSMMTMGATKGGGGNSGGGGMSKGGKVPGKPKVFGDNEQNDTVKAILSPGEIVIPRSIVNSPDAPVKAAKFVKNQKAQHFDSGGTAGLGGDPNAYGNGIGSGGSYPNENLLQVMFAPATSQASQAPTIQNGGLLDTTQLDANNANYNQLLSNMQNSQAGQQITRSQTQNAQDSAIHQILVNAAKGDQASKAALIGAGTQHMQEIAGQSATQSQNFQMQNTQAIAQLLGQKRGNDINQEIASQKAAWNQTMLNLHLSLAQQQMMMGILSGAGQAATSFSNSKVFGSGQNNGPYDYSQNPSADPNAIQPGQVLGNMSSSDDDDED